MQLKVTAPEIVGLVASGKLVKAIGVCTADCDTCRWMAPETYGRANGQSAVHIQPQSPGERKRALQALLACPSYVLNPCIAKHCMLAQLRLTESHVLLQFRPIRWQLNRFEVEVAISQNHVRWFCIWQLTQLSLLKRRPWNRNRRAGSWAHHLKRFKAAARAFSGQSRQEPACLDEPCTHVWEHQPKPLLANVV